MSDSDAKDTQITLIGENIAEVGKEFIYRGETDACEG
ncbi:MAG: UPF0179 family protein, partial [Halobacteria archaeon]|nr:UPF0179 family protein [Halobacteria archaeon]